MTTDDKRMHGGNTPGLVPGRGHERHEAPVRLGVVEPGADDPPLDGPAQDLIRDLNAGGEQGNALGGHVATHSGTIETPEGETRDGASS